MVRPSFVLYPAAVVVLAAVTLAPASERARRLHAEPPLAPAAPGKEPVAPRNARPSGTRRRRRSSSATCGTTTGASRPTARVGELAGPMNEMLKAARASRACSSIHAPSTCTDFYKDTPQRKRAPDGPVRQDAGAAGHHRALGHGLVLARRQARGRAADRRLRHGLRLQGEVRDPLAVDAADRGHRDRRRRRHHRQRPGDVEPARRAEDRQRDPVRRPPEHVRAGPAVRHPPDGEARARTWP